MGVFIIQTTKRECYLRFGSITDQIQAVQHGYAVLLTQVLVRRHRYETQDMTRETAEQNRKVRKGTQQEKDGNEFQWRFLNHLARAVTYTLKVPCVKLTGSCVCHMWPTVGCMPKLHTF